ncbi:MAG: DUF167 family protein [Holosporales bacterium]|nr:DUF167 family protein [Holosporales bacterium]
MLELVVRVTPRASSNRIKEVTQDTANSGKFFLKVYVTTAPEAGKANKTVIELLAKTLKIPKSGLAVISGQKSRTKFIRIYDISEEKICEFIKNSRFY